MLSLVEEGDSPVRNIFLIRFEGVFELVQTGFVFGGHWFTCFFALCCYYRQKFQKWLLRYRASRVYLLFHRLKVFSYPSYIYGSLSKLLMHGLVSGWLFLFVIWCKLVHVAIKSYVLTVNILESSFWEILHFTCVLRQMLVLDIVLTCTGNYFFQKRLHPHRPLNILRFGARFLEQEIHQQRIMIQMVSRTWIFMLATDFDCGWL